MCFTSLLVGSTVLLGKSLSELEELAVQLGQQRFRGKQILDGVLQGAKSVDDIANLPAVSHVLQSGRFHLTEAVSHSPVVTKRPVRADTFLY